MLQQRTTSAQHLLPVILQAWIHKRNIRPLKMLRKSGLLGKGWSPAAGDQSKVHTLLRHREERSSTQLPYTLTHRHSPQQHFCSDSPNGEIETLPTPELWAKAPLGQGSYGSRLPGRAWIQKPQDRCFVLHLPFHPPLASVSLTTGNLERRSLTELLKSLTTEQRFKSL